MDVGAISRRVPARRLLLLTVAGPAIGMLGAVLAFGAVIVASVGIIAVASRRMT